MSLTKKILLTLTVLLTLGGGGSLVDKILGKPNHPEIIVRSALENTFTQSAKYTESRANIILPSGKLALHLDGNIINTDRLLPTADFELELSGKLPIENQPSLESRLNFRIVNDEIFLQIINFTLTGKGEKITAAQDYFESIIGKWWTLPIGKLTAENPDIAKIVAEKTEAQKNFRIQLKDLLSNKTMFAIKQASGSFFAGKYNITVAPQLGEAFSADMVNNLGNLLGYDSPEAITKLQTRLKQFPEITLSISRRDNLILGFTTTLPIGESSLILENQMRPLPDSVDIIPPSNSEYLDLTAFNAAFGSIIAN